MSELEGMLNSVLSNPEEMKKIMEMANSIMSSNAAASVETSTPPAPEQSHDNVQGMPDLSALGNLAGSGGGDLTGILKGLSSLPPGLFSAAQKLMGGGKNDKEKLFKAIGQYLSPARREKLEKAVSMSRMMGIGLSLFGEKGGLL